MKLKFFSDKLVIYKKSWNNRFLFFFYWLFSKEIKSGYTLIVNVIVIIDIFKKEKIRICKLEREIKKRTWKKFILILFMK